MPIGNSEQLFREIAKICLLPALILPPRFTPIWAVPARGITAEEGRKYAQICEADRRCHRGTRIGVRWHCLRRGSGRAATTSASILRRGGRLRGPATARLRLSAGAQLSLLLCAAPGGSGAAPLLWALLLRRRLRLPGLWVPRVRALRRPRLWTSRPLLPLPLIGLLPPRLLASPMPRSHATRCG